MSFQVKVLPLVRFALTGPTHTRSVLTVSFLRFGRLTSSQTLPGETIANLGRDYCSRWMNVSESAIIIGPQHGATPSRGFTSVGGKVDMNFLIRQCHGQ